MKKILYVILFFTGIVNGQIVNIPDANFKAELLNSSVSNFIASNTYPATSTSFFKIDANNDGEIQVSEAVSVYYLNIAISDIADLAGIEQFINLRFLNCSMNNLTNIENLNSLTNLIHLDCESNDLTTINVNPLINLTKLDCALNQLTTLDVSELPNISELYCSSNQLSTIIVNPLNNISILQCSQNEITNLDESVLTNLTFLNCSYNQLTSLDLSELTSLTELYCHNNNLTFLNLKNGSTETELLFSFNSDLVFVCADENQLNDVQNKINTYGYTNCNLNSYCSFTPGGNNNLITGTMLFDADSNGCDALDMPHPNIKININDGTSQGATFTNNSGNYNFYTQAGSFDVTPNVENPTWFTFSPTTATVAFADNNNNISTQNFCITANGVHPDVEIAIAPITPARPGFDALYQIVYKNIGNQMTSGTIDFNFNDTVLDFISATVAPNGSSVGILNWNYTDLLPFENRSIYVTLNVNSPQETPPVNIGDQLYFTTAITSSAGDEMLEDNFFGYNQTVVGSFDPNDITCIEGDVVPTSDIGEYLHYVINFENTGTAEAENIVVRTDIDATQFDVNSLQMLNTSHNAYIRQTGATIEFIFEGIYLDTGGHGNVLLKIKSLNTLQEGDVVAKQANIFFDCNFPIETNMANTTFQALNTPGFEIDESISVYPNPTNSIVTIKCNNSMQSVQLYDVQGRLLQTQIINNQTTTVDLSQQSSGIYFVKVTSENGEKVEKIVKN